MAFPDSSPDGTHSSVGGFYVPDRFTLALL